jgi:hypothetical protein
VIPDSSRSRREFLKFLAASPLLAAMPARLAAQDFVISDPAEAVNVLDFEVAAQTALPPAHWGYLRTR